MKMLRMLAILSVLMGAALYARPERLALQPWYAWYNIRYFGDSLPQNTIVKWDDLTSRKAMGLTSVIDQRYVIQIDTVTNLATVTTQESLIHEMCHVWVEENVEQPLPDGDHGVAFQDCMMDKAKQGAFHDLW